MILLSITQKVNSQDAILGFYVQWLAGMAKRVDRLQVIALEKGPHDLPPNTEVVSLGKERGAGRLALFFAFHRSLARICRTRQRPHAILAHMVPKYVLYALPWAKLYRIPIDLWYTHKGVDKYLRMAHPFIRHAFTASEESFRLPSAKKVVTGHGIDVDLFSPPEEGVRSGLVTVGRITPSKDQAVLIEALALLKKHRTAEELTTNVVGEPLLDSDRDYLSRLREQVERRDLTDTVRFRGAVPHGRMRDVYGAARIMVNASHTGSVDKVVLEAMASGAIPLTCNESFIALLGDLSQTLVFRKGDAQDLADRVERILGLDESERRSLQERLRAMVVEKHNLDKLLDCIVTRMGGKV